MATIIKRGDTWQARVRRTGFPVQSRAFERKADAEAWARVQESKMDAGTWRDDRTIARGTRNPSLLPLVRLALETAMRRGEILSLRWEHVDLRTRVAHLPLTKNGDARDVPLSTAATDVLKKLQSRRASIGRGRVLGTTESAMKQAFERAVASARKACATRPPAAWRPSF